MEKYMHNPELAQKQVLDLIDNAYGEDVVVTNATNPFNMLLEASSIMAANAATEAFNITRKKYADLALTREDLWHHMSDDEIVGVFSKPGSTSIFFKVSVTDIISNGIRPTGAKYIECTIPEKTVITVYDTDLTLLNDIVIKYYDNGSTFVEMQPNDNPVSVKDVGVIASYVTVDEDGAHYICFETDVDQITVSTFKYNVVSAEGFNKTLPMKTEKNKLYYTVVKYQSANTGNVAVRLPIYYNDEYLDPYTPCAYVKVVDNDVTDKLVTEAVNVYIPDIFFVNGKISGTITVEVYETIGSLYLPLSDALPEDYNFTLGMVGKSTSTAAMKNITTVIASRGTIVNGTSGLTFEELRHAIIFNTKGKQNLPITDYQLSFNNVLDGFKVVKDTDILTSRSYIALRNLSKDRVDSLRAMQDVYFNNIALVLDDYPRHRSLAVFPDMFTIKSGAVFKGRNGGVDLVQEEVLEDMARLTGIERVDFYKENKYFVTPYYYVVSIENNQSGVNVYDLDRPTISAMRILDVNREIDHRANTTAWRIYKKKDGYEVVTAITKNNEAAEIPQENFKAVLGIELVTGNILYIQGVYDAGIDGYRFKIDTDHYINRSHNIRFTNGDATTLTKMADLKSKAYFYIYTTDDTIVDPLNMLKDALPYELDPYVMITRETITIDFGVRLANIWAKLALSYTERKYARYTADELAYYTEDVLEPDPDTGWLVGVQNNSLTARFIHHKGDPVLDEDGNHVVKHRKGEVILGDNGLPVIDNFGGVIRHMDICMLDYEFYLATNAVYLKHNEMCLDQLREYMLNIIPDKLDNLLENTTLQYKSYKSSYTVKAKVNDVIYGLEPYVKPNIVVYYSQNIEFKLSTADLEKMTDIIGHTIDKYLENDTIKLSEIRENLKKELGDNVISVRIKGIDPLDSELIVIEDKSKRLSMAKELVMNEYNQLEVKYSIDVSIQTIPM